MRIMEQASIVQLQLRNGMTYIYRPVNTCICSNREQPSIYLGHFLSCEYFCPICAVSIIKIKLNMHNLSCEYTYSMIRRWGKLHDGMSIVFYLSATFWTSFHLAAVSQWIEYCTRKEKIGCSSPCQPQMF